MSDVRPQYVQYLFLRLDSVFHNLESNERIVAKQQFMGAWESFQSRALLVSYSLTGLRADCDVLCVRVSDSLELLQDMTCRLQSSGMGKYFTPAYSFLAVTSGPRYAAKSASGDFVLGQGRYLFLSPWTRSPEWFALGPAKREAAERAAHEVAAKHRVRLHPGLRGLDEVDDIVAAEADDPRQYMDFAAAFREARHETHAPAGPTFAAVLKDIRDQVDCLG